MHMRRENMTPGIGTHQHILIAKHYTNHICSTANKPHVFMQQNITQIKFTFAAKHHTNQIYFRSKTSHKSYILAAKHYTKPIFQQQIIIQIIFFTSKNITQN